MLKHPKITQDRLARILQFTLPAAIYGPGLPLTISAHHVHGEPIPPREAYNRPYEPFHVGQAWGAMWDTTWFHFEGRIPPEWYGLEVVARIDLGYQGNTGFGAEGLVWQGESPVQGISPNHNHYTLTRSAKGGEAVDFYVEAAANPHASFYYPAPLLMPDYNGQPMLTLQRAELAVFNRAVYTFALEFKILYELMQELPQNEPRANQIMYALNQTVNLLDLQDVAGSIKPAHAPLQEMLERHNGSTVHRISAVGHAHIDTAWLWPLRETQRKCARTFSTAVSLMDEYPQYVFGCSQAVQYAWIKEFYPALWERIKAKVKTGQFEPIGSMWVEADCNISSGESLVRQIIHGKRFFMDEFGYETKEVWLPDVFGYAASMPQMMKKAGIDYFMTQKISWSQFNKFPHHTFLWEGIDGTRVFTHFPPADTYNGSFTMKELQFNVHNFKEHDRATRSLYAYGYGDGGGGPTRDMIETGLRLDNLEGAPAVTLERVSSFFPKAVKDAIDLPVWVGELYLELHRGTYTTQARNKRGNRKSELGLREAEFLCAVRPNAFARYPWQALDQAWKLVLLNQFHDIIPGSSIHWVYEDSARHYAEIANVAEAAAQAAAQAIVASVNTQGMQQPVVALNTTSHARSSVVCVPIAGATAPKYAVCEGEATPVQLSADGKCALFAARVPAAGYVTYDLAADLDARSSVLPDEDNAVRISGNSMENAMLRVTWDANGLLTSIYDKGVQREVLEPGRRGNIFQLFEDVPNNWDAWDVDLPYQEKMQEITGLESMAVVETGPVRAGVCFVRKFGASTITQTMSLVSDTLCLAFETEVDWQESHKFLKVAFPVDVHAPRATYEIQYGHLERPTHSNTSWDLARFEVAAQKWADLSEPGYGVALLNDCKYGYDIWGNTMRLSLLRAPVAPDPLADRGTQRFSYALLPHAGDFRPGGVIDEAYDFNVPLRVVPTDAHPGALPPGQSFFKVDCPNAVIEVVKKAESEDALVVRLYESFGGRSPICLSTTLPVKRAYLTDLLERNQQELTLQNGSVQLDLKPFEIVTVKFEL